MRLLFVLVMTLSPLSHATPLSEPALFARCYSHLTGRPVPVNHALMAKVRSGDTTGLSACYTLMDKARLNTSGALADANDSEATAILNQFYNFHRSLFSVSSFEQMPEADREYGANTDDLFDISQPALGMTKVLFGGHKYSELITTLGDVRAVRRPVASLNTMYGYTQNSPSRRVFYNNVASRPLDSLQWAFRGTGSFDSMGTGSVQVAAPSVQTGELIGIRPATETLMVPNFTFYPLAPSATAELRGDQAPGITLPFNAFEPAGAGILGYPIYILSYWGQSKMTPLNGTTKLPRRWAISTMQNFMCAQMPDLRAEDVTQYLDSSSSAPFRLQSSCLGCHATQDQMAYTLRNYQLAFSDFSENVDAVNGGLTNKTSHLLAHYTPSQPSVSGWSAQPVASFHLQQPNGRLYMRTLAGKLVDQPVSNLNELGAALAAQDDYYLCAAKHYFQFLTGIQVPLFDRENPANATLLKNLSPQSVADRKFLETIAAQLKNDPNQSLIGLLKAIMSSDYYRDSNYRPK